MYPITDNFVISINRRSIEIHWKIERDSCRNKKRKNYNVKIN